MPVRIVTVGTGDAWVVYTCAACGKSNRHTLAAAGRHGLACRFCDHRLDLASEVLAELNLAQGLEPAGTSGSDH